MRTITVLALRRLGWRGLGRRRSASRPELTSRSRRPAPQLGLHLLELCVDLRRARELLQLTVDVVLTGAQLSEVLERSGCLELLDRIRPRLHVLGLVERSLHRKADVRHLLPHAGGGLRDTHLSLGGRVLGLDDLLLGAELLDLRAQLLLGFGQPLLLLLELGDLAVQRPKLGLGDVLALERGAGEVLASLGERLPSLRVELDDLVLEALLLDLKALLGRDDVGDALLYVLEQLDLLLVAVLERRRRIFGAVEQLGDLGFDER